jgi:hypothetical protein
MHDRIDLVPGAEAVLKAANVAGEYQQSFPARSLNGYGHTSSSLRGVIPEIDIWRAVYLMVWWYGDTATAER